MMNIQEKKRQQFTQAMKFRHACKLFDVRKKISKADQKYILEAGRLSPSSMGLEPWEFWVFESKKDKLKLQEACRDQVQVGTASFDVIVWAKVKEMDPKSDYIDKMTDRYGEHKEKRKAYYTDFYQRKFPDGAGVKEWAIVQDHLAAANMMTAAAFIGIDSCPIGGFEAEKVKALFSSSSSSPSFSSSSRKKYDLQGKEAALILCFGYRGKEQPEKKRLKVNDVVKFIHL